MESWRRKQGAAGAREAEGKVQSQKDEDHVQAQDDGEVPDDEEAFGADALS